MNFCSTAISVLSFTLLHSTASFEVVSRVGGIWSGGKPATLMFGLPEGGGAGGGTATALLSCSIWARARSA